MRNLKLLRACGSLLAVAVLLTGCVSSQGPVFSEKAGATPATGNHPHLVALPPPAGKIPVSVYGFRDQTGQYQAGVEASTFSTAVTQGGAALLIKALRDSQWFAPLEREGLQNLLTERRIMRASRTQQGIEEELHPLAHAAILLEGGITAYESNVLTGGAGAQYFGIGSSTQYRMDQVTVHLRAVDTRTGQILSNVSATKTVLSQEVRAGVFRFIKFNRLLEAETGMTVNEPVQLSVLDAIEEAVIALIVDGVDNNLWSLANSADINHPLLKTYRQSQHFLPLQANRKK